MSIISRGRTTIAGEKPVLHCTYQAACFAFPVGKRDTGDTLPTIWEWVARCLRP
jgi:hypothetical protein